MLLELVVQALQVLLHRHGGVLPLRGSHWTTCTPRRTWPAHPRLPLPLSMRLLPMLVLPLLPLLVSLYLEVLFRQQPLELPLQNVERSTAEARRPPSRAPNLLRLCSCAPPRAPLHPLASKHLSLI